MTVIIKITTYLYLGFLEEKQNVTDFVSQTMILRWSRDDFDKMCILRTKQEDSLTAHAYIWELITTKNNLLKTKISSW